MIHVSRPRFERLVRKAVLVCRRIPRSARKRRHCGPAPAIRTATAVAPAFRAATRCWGCIWAFRRRGVDLATPMPCRIEFSSFRSRSSRSAAAKTPSSHRCGRRSSTRSPTILGSTTRGLLNLGWRLYLRRRLARSPTQSGSYLMQGSPPATPHGPRSQRRAESGDSACERRPRMRAPHLSEATHGAVTE